MGRSIGTRGDYHWFAQHTTRWGDNDAFAHVNNVQYYSFFDTTVARFLMQHGIMDPGQSEYVAVVVESLCRYHAPVAFPDALTVGLRVEHLGNSSIRYGIGVFRNEEEHASAEGHFVHVFVRRDAQSQPVPLPEALRRAAAPLMFNRQAAP